jgi:hypothetical protein
MKKPQIAQMKADARFCRGEAAPRPLSLAFFDKKEHIWQTKGEETSYARECSDEKYTAR